MWPDKGNWYNGFFSIINFYMSLSVERYFLSFLAVMAYVFIEPILEIDVSLINFKNEASHWYFCVCWIRHLPLGTLIESIMQTYGRSRLWPKNAVTYKWKSKTPQFNHSGADTKIISGRKDRYHIRNAQRSRLLTWLNFHPSMDAQLHSLQSVGWNYLQTLKLQRCNRLCFGKGK